MPSTVQDFLDKRGRDGFVDLEKCFSDPKMKDTDTAAEFKVTAACVSQWRTKFFDIFIVLKEEVLSELERNCDIYADNIEEQRAFIEGQRSILRFIRGRKASRSVTEDPNAPPRTIRDSRR